MSRAWKLIDRNWSKWKKNLLIGDRRLPVRRSFAAPVQSRMCTPPSRVSALAVPSQVYTAGTLRWLRSILGDAVDYVGVDFHHEELAEAAGRSRSSRTSQPY